MESTGQVVWFYLMKEAQAVSETSCIFKQVQFQLIG